MYLSDSQHPTSSQANSYLRSAILESEQHVDGLGSTSYRVSGYSCNIFSMFAYIGWECAFLRSRLSRNRFVILKRFLRDIMYFLEIHTIEMWKINHHANKPQELNDLSVIRIDALKQKGIASVLTPTPAPTATVWCWGLLSLKHPPMTQYCSKKLSNLELAIWTAICHTWASMPLKREVLLMLGIHGEHEWSRWLPGIFL